jgi:molybdenum cofactor cytidylyltransferase
MRIAAIVLAAGLSRRMGASNKLLLPLGGTPMVVHALACFAGAVEEIVVVTGHEREAVAAAVKSAAAERGADLPARCVHNSDYERGMGTSIARGAEALREADAIFVHLGDVPAVDASTVRALTGAFADASRPAILFPVHDDRRGHPVLFDAAFHPQLTALTGDTGAKPIVRSHPNAVATVPVTDPGIHRDVDTEAAYQQIRTSNF